MMRLVALLVVLFSASFATAAPSTKPVEFACTVVSVSPDARPLLFVIPKAGTKSPIDSTGYAGLLIQNYPKSKKAAANEDLFVRVSPSGTYSFKQADGTWTKYLMLNWIADFSPK